MKRDQCLVSRSVRHAAASSLIATATLLSWGLAAAADSSLADAARSAHVDLAQSKTSTGAQIVQSRDAKIGLILTGQPIALVKVVSKKHALNGFYQVKVRSSDSGYVADLVDTSGTVAGSFPAEVGASLSKHGVGGGGSAPAPIHPEFRVGECNVEVTSSRGHTTISIGCRDVTIIIIL